MIRGIVFTADTRPESLDAELVEHVLVIFSGCPVKRLLGQ